jgi:hypothetical protein
MVTKEQLEELARARFEIAHGPVWQMMREHVRNSWIDGVRDDLLAWKKLGYDVVNEVAK